MRAPVMLLAAVAIVVAGCSSGQGVSQSPSAPPPTVTLAPTTLPTTAPTARPVWSPTPVSARVAFDGSKCAYTGPTVIPFPATLTIEYAPTPAQESSWVGIFAIRSGTTQAELTDPSNPPVGVGTPAFVYEDTAHGQQGSGTFAYPTVLMPNGRPYDTYLVICVPKLPGQPVGGSTILHVIS